MIYSCCNENRRSAVLASASLNGIDYLEVLDHDAIALDSPRQCTLLIHCLKAAPAGLTPSNVLISGGESITNITVQWIAQASAPPAALTNPKERAFFQALSDAANVLVVRTGQAGDFSTYEFRLVNNAAQALEDPFEVTEVLKGFDLQLASVQFSFKVECGPDFDCAPVPPVCPPQGPVPPPINYLAKDYGSFRTVILDRLSQLIPGWARTSEADLGVALAELLAYVGDRLSYQQDAVATEAYIGTARSRVSLRRHALLVDYHVHDGANARAWIQLQVQGSTGDSIFLDRTLARFYTFAPGMPATLKVGTNNEEAALLAGVQVFEPMWDAVLHPEHNQMSFYTWGDTNCCLQRGATEAALKGTFPNLHPGDVLIFQEMKGPQTGDPADADIRHRCAVRLTQVAIQDGSGKPLADPLFSVLVTEIQWSAEDALPFPVCISSAFLDDRGDQQTASDVSVAFGNVVLADHGLSFTSKDFGVVPAPSIFVPRDPAADRCQLSPPTPVPVRFRPVVPDSPLTQTVPLPSISLPAAGIPVTATPVLFGAAGVASFKDSHGFSCLTLRATNPLGWPGLFGALVVANSGHPANFDLSVVYDPPGGAAGLNHRVVVEQFTNLSLAPADPNFVVHRINSASKLIQVPAGYVPPTTPPAGFPGTPTLLSNSGPVNLQDLSPTPITYLTLEPNNPAGWWMLFGVSAQPGSDPTLFELDVVFDITSPIIMESFPNLSLATAAVQIDAKSLLTTVDGFAQTAAANLSAAAMTTFDASHALPAITLSGTLNAQTQSWTPVPDLLESGESDRNFVVEVESDITATLRFGDDEHGLTPEAGTAFTATYRIGNGTAGNVGADSLVFLITGDARIQSSRNPLPATGGIDPETNEQIRRRAPQAFLTQQRAVTRADYAAVAEANAQVDQAVASLHWTGSWYTVFVAVEPKGGGNLTAALAKTLKSTENRYRLAGQDLELASPEYVSLEISLEICADPNYFRSDVERALLIALTTLFAPDQFTFGQTVYLSPIYAAARSVAGVTAVRAVTFQPQGINSTQYLSAGEIKLGPLQVARLENNRSFPDHGQLTLTMEGGK
jgi:uncharacterized phage protein gp47/JayE